MNATWNYADPPVLLAYKQAVQFYDRAIALGMTGEPSPNPQDAEIISLRKTVNYTAWIAGLQNDMNSNWNWADSPLILMRKMLANLVSGGGGGGGGGITSIVAGAGIDVTNPTGPAVTVAATGSWPPPTDEYQQGSVNLVAGTQSYAVVFSPALTGVPAVVGVQVYMNDADGEVLVATPQKDTVTANGFTFWLSGVPADTGGVAKWTAQV